MTRLTTRLTAAPIAALLAPSLLALSLTAPALAAGHGHGGPGHGRLTVTGTGIATAEPDIARLSMAASGEAQEPADALAQASRGIASVITALTGMGIAERDLQTTAVDLQPVYARPQPGQVPRITGYRATNRLSVTVRDLDRVGAAIAEGTAAGAAELGQISFDIADRDALEAEARAAAMRDAMARAAQLAEAGNLTLGPVRQVVEGGGMRPGPMPMGRTAMMAAESVPVMGGTLEAQISVSVTFALGQAE